jgi:hypothetical protein
MISNTTTVTTTAALVVASSQSWRTIYIHVIGTGVVYLGGSDITTANGLLTEKNAVPLMLEIPAGEELWALTDTGTENLRIMKPLRA